MNHLQIKATANRTALIRRIRTTLVVAAILAQPAVPRVAAQILINEALAANQSVIANDGSFPDYVELINLDSQTADLGGWSLTDDPADPRAFVRSSRVR